VLDIEVVQAQSIEDEVDMLQVLCPRRVVDQIVVEKDQHKPAKGWRTSFMST
jgi:hypothetical protein